VSVDFAEKYQTARMRVFAVLSDLAWHDWRELEKVGGIRYGARLLELRRLGYLIETADLEDGKRYRLKALERVAPQKKKVKVLLEEGDAEALLSLGLFLTPGGRLALTQALESYRVNKHKL
jgi:hypothetical protein